MKRCFIVSLCKNGILGGAIRANNEAITYSTGKLTVPKEYKRIEMKYSEIAGVEKGWMLLFPTAMIEMKDGRKFKFIVFNRRRFMRTLTEMGVTVQGANPARQG